MAKTFKVGDRVRWWGISGGFQKAHVGYVEIIIPALVHPRNMHPQDKPEADEWPATVGDLARTHESYFVRDAATDKMYWPLVSRLSKA